MLCVWVYFSILGWSCCFSLLQLFRSVKILHAADLISPNEWIQMINLTQQQVNCIAKLHLEIYLFQHALGLENICYTNWPAELWGIKLHWC